MKIVLENVCKSYSDAGHELQVIEHVQFTFPEAGSVAIVGRSGVGKSTLLHLLAGLDLPDSGKVMLDGIDLSTLSSEALAAFRGKNIGVVFQFSHLLPEFNAIENVAMPLVIAGESEASATRQAKTLLERVELGSRANHRPGELSGGEQQRVAIARALVAAPRIVLADEPTGNLDMETAQRVQGLLLETQRELNNVLILVTHSHDLARSMGSVVEMQPGGKLVACQI